MSDLIASACCRVTAQVASRDARSVRVDDRPRQRGA
jgi:hypothetical protein